MKKMTFVALILILLSASAVFAAREAYTGWKADVEAKLASGDFAGAMTLLKAAEAGGTTDADYYFLLGKANSASNNLDESLKNIDKAISMDPKFTEAMGHKSIVLLRQGKTKEAEDLATKAIAIEPSGELYYARGAMRMQQGRFEDAIADLDQAIALEPKNNEYFVARGEVRLRIGRAAEAEKDYARAIELDPKNPKAFLGRGGLLLLKGNLSDARIDLDHCIELAPKFSSCYLRRGKLQQMKGDSESGLRDYATATDLEPSSVEAWFERSMAELETSRFEDAETSARKILSLENSGRANKVLGMVLSARGKNKDAIDAYSAAVKASPKDYESYYLRGNVYALNKDFEMAIADLDKAISLEQRYIDPYVTKANIYMAKKEPDKAIAACDAAIAIAPKNASLYQLRSDLYQAMGNFDKSFEDLKKSKALAAEAREKE